MVGVWYMVIGPWLEGSAPERLNGWKGMICPTTISNLASRVGEQGSSLSESMEGFFWLLKPKYFSGEDVRVK